jgi:peptide/nickel transport system substrate-binding protein
MDGGLHFFNFTPELRPGVVDPDIYEAFDWEKRIHEIFVKSISEMDEQARWDLFAEFQMIVTEQQPLIYTVSQNILYAYKDTLRLANDRISEIAGALWDIHGVWKD